MAIPEVSDLPPAPAPGDSPTEFNDKAYPFAAALQTLVDEFNAATEAFTQQAQELVNAAFSATSASSVSIGTGVKSFTLDADAAFVAGQTVIASSDADPSNYMIGEVTSYDSGTDALIVDVTAIGGGGTHADWTIGLSLSPELLAESGTEAGALALLDDIDLAVTTVTGTLAEFNVALSDGDFASLDGAETLANKLLDAIGAASTIEDDNGDPQPIGYQGAPVDADNSGRTLGLNDIGKVVEFTGGNATIPANSATAFPVGTMIGVLNNKGSDMDILINTDTLILEGDGSTGTRTLADQGYAVLHKVAATTWYIISGSVS